MENYNIPLGIDTKNILTGLDAIDAGLGNLSVSAKDATTSLSNLMTNSAKGGDALVSKINSGATAAKVMSDAAKGAGVEIEKMFSPDRINTFGLQTKVGTFIAKMKDVVGQPMDLKFNLDQARIDLLSKKFGEAKGQIGALEMVLESAKSRLNDFVKGSDPFRELSKQIKEADDFLNILKQDAAELGDELATPPPDGGGIPGVGDEAEAAAPKVKSFRTQLKEMREELIAMELAGKGGSTEFIELSTRAGELADQIGDTQSRIRGLASDTKRIDAGIAAFRGLAGAFAVAQGALAAFGEQNEEVQKTIQKVQGAMAILQGVQEVANVLNKDSALMVWLETYAMQANTAAVAENTVVVEAEAAATETATVATEAWTTALLANPIVAIIAILAVATAALYQFAKAQDQGGLSAADFNKQLEAQQKLLEADFSRIEARKAINDAEANEQRKHQSDLTQIEINALAQKRNANRLAIDESQRALLQLNKDDDKYAETYKAGKEKIEAMEEKDAAFFDQMRALEINKRVQHRDEVNKIQLDALHQRQANAEAERSILEEAQKYANEINNLKIGALKDGHQKELAILHEATAEKLQALQKETEAAKIRLQNQKAELALDISTEKLIRDLKKAGLSQQLKAEGEAELQRRALRKQIREAEAAEEAKIAADYQQKREDQEFQTAITLLNIQKETAKQKEAILTLNAQKELAIIEKSDLDAVTKEYARIAIEKKLQKDIADSNLDFQLKQIDIDKTANENRLMLQKGFFDKSRDGQAFANALLLKNQMEADQKKLDALIAAGKNEEDQEVINARNAVEKSTAAYNQAMQDAKPISWEELLFPGDKKAQALADGAKAMFEEVGKAVDAYSNMMIASYQAQIDIQKKLIQADDDALNDLKGRLDEEKDLQKQGLANNVDGIRKEIDEKNKQRAQDIQKAEEYQKQMEKVQKAQIRMQTALQAVNLATAATDVFAKLAVFGPVGVAIATVTIAAMIASFVAARSQAMQAATAGATFAEGGEIGGRSHAQGGQKYQSMDGSGGVVELEDGEFVVRKTQTQKHKKLLQAINENNFEMLSERDLHELLMGTGAYVDIQRVHEEGLKESREHTAHSISATYVVQRTPEELKSIDANMAKLVEHHQEAEQVYEEDGYIVRKKGNKIVKTRKN